MSSEEAVEYEETIEYDEPVPEWHLQIIEERMARYAQEDTQWIPWEEVEKEMFDLLFSQKLLKD